ncbi:MAG: DUF1465 family protein [Nitratireductor sp.]|nr:DUF1465 family protein [Nitratireductor sp.]
MDTSSNSKPDNTVNLAEHFAFSGKFNQLFSDGMTLVEESASYLDGPGRDAARQLPKASIVLYGTESMRLTTRLMQLASWLLLQRAAKEGEMNAEQFLEEKKKVKLETLPASAIDADWDMLPEEFVSLVNRSLALQNRITSIDAEVYARAGDTRQPRENPVLQQLSLLSTALGTKLN